jgi:hypothetical protein
MIEFRMSGVNRVVPPKLVYFNGPYRAAQGLIPLGMSNECRFSAYKCGMQTRDLTR